MNFCQKYVLLFWPSKKKPFCWQKRLELKIWFHRTCSQDNREKYQSTYYLSKNIIFVAIRNFCRKIEQNVYLQHITKLRVICTLMGYIYRNLAYASKKSFQKMLENINACLIIVQITRNFVICWKYTFSLIFRQKFLMATKIIFFERY